MFDFSSAVMEIVDENGNDIIGMFDMKKGAKYSIQIDLKTDLYRKYQEKLEGCSSVIDYYRSISRYAFNITMICSHIK